MKRMLFNATQHEELRVAMVDGQRLYDLNIELPASERKKANIYKGTITRIEPSLEAAFVNYGAERHGFLPLKEISSEYFLTDASSGGKPNIREVLKEGQDIVVQIDKEERGNKGAALTTFVSLAGRFIVLKPNKSRSGGVSRRIVGEDRDLARKSLKEITVPEGMSVILRTAGIDRSAEELEWDLNNLLGIWEAIKMVVVQRPSPFLIYRESDAVVRALRDYLTNEIGEILIDDDAAYNDAREFIEQVMPHNLRKLKHYVDPVPLFTRYQIESQIESAFAHQVTLPSGGSMVIDHTEALVSIDINSARATKGGDIEATALQTNLEAADEIGRQLRLRDLGGLIVIDFIDMGPQKHQREVETRLREAVRQDRARVQIGKISRFGLLEMSRQRLRPSLGESNYLTCPRCSGVGNIRSVESLALAILRIVGEEARKERTSKVIAQLPVEVATYLLNEKRDWVQNVESRHDTQVILVANSMLETPHYQVRRVRDDQLELPENVGASYELAEPEEEQIIPQAVQSPKPETPAIASVVQGAPAPKRKSPQKTKKKGPGILARIVGLFSTEEDRTKTKKRAAGRKPRKKADGRARGGQRARRRPDGKKSGDGRKPSRGKKAAKKQGKSDAKEKSKRAAADEPKPKKAKKKPQQAPRKTATDDKAADARASSGRRRSRGGRRRRRGQDAADATVAVAGAAAAADTNAESAVKQEHQRSPAEQPAAAAKTAKEERRHSAEQSAPAAKEDRQRSKREQPAAQEDRQRSQREQPPAAQEDRQPSQVEHPAAKEDRQPSQVEQPAAKEDRQRSQREQPAPAEARTQRPKDTAETSAAAADERSKEAPPSTESSSYEDTQPELPVIRMPEEEPSRPQAAEPSEPLQVKSAQLEAMPATPTEATKRASDTTAEKGGNGDSRPAEKTGAKPAKTEDEAAKPKGRLLPWEPQAPVEKPAPDAESPDK